MRWTFLLFLLIPEIAFTQRFGANILERDSFPADVKSYSVTGTMWLNDSTVDTSSTFHFYLVRRFWPDGSSFRSLSQFGWTSSADDSTWYNAKRTERYTLYMKSGVVKTEKLNKRGQLQKEQATPGRGHHRIRYNRNGTVRREVNVTSWPSTKTVLGRTYNKRDQLIHQSYACADCRFPETERYFYYDSSGNNTKIVRVYHKRKSPDLADTTWQTFDSAGRVVASLIHHGGTSKYLESFSYVYDVAGRLRERHQLKSGINRPLVIDLHTYVEYDAMGYCSSYISIRHGVREEQRWETIYNDSGLPLSCTFNDVNKTQHYEWKYEYN